jgi:hypothetical protein
VVSAGGDAKAEVARLVTKAEVAAVMAAALFAVAANVRFRAGCHPRVENRFNAARP